MTRRDAVDIRVQPLTNWPYPGDRTLWNEVQALGQRLSLRRK